MPKTSPRNTNAPATTAAAPARPAGHPPAEVAAYLGGTGEDPLPVEVPGIGPSVHKVGRHLRYRWPEVDAWLNAQPRTASRSEFRLGTAKRLPASHRREP